MGGVCGVVTARWMGNVMTRHRNHQTRTEEFETMKPYPVEPREVSKVDPMRAGPIYVDLARVPRVGTWTAPDVVQVGGVGCGRERRQVEGEV